MPELLVLILAGCLLAGILGAAYDTRQQARRAITAQVRAEAASAEATRQAAQAATAAATAARGPRQPKHAGNGDDELARLHARLRADDTYVMKIVRGRDGLAKLGKEARRG